MHEDVGAGAAAREALERLVGTLEAEVSVFAGSWGAGAAARESRGVMVNAWVLGGRYLEQRYESKDTDGAPMRGVGYRGVSEDGACEYVWLDSVSGAMMTGRGTCSPDGRVNTIEGSTPGPNGSETRHRCVTTILSEDEHEYEIFLTPPGGEAFRAVRIRYTRSRL